MCRCAGKVGVLVVGVVGGREVGVYAVGGAFAADGGGG